ASKAGIVAITRNMAFEVARRRITVNAIAPGLTDTAQPRYGMTVEEIAAAGPTIPLGRIAQPEDMLPTVLFLCGPGGGYTTGQPHPVNGGGWMVQKRSPTPGPSPVRGGGEQATSTPLPRARGRGWG